MIKYNGQEIKVSKFPNGEMCIQPFSVEHGVHFLQMKYESAEDIVLLHMIKKHLDDKGANDVVLQLPYVPFSRMDRSEDGSIPTLKYFCNLINGLNFSSVVILEPHSDVTTALLDRCTVIHSSKMMAEKIIKEEGLDKEKDVIYYPDATAYKRYNKNFKQFKYHMVGNKIREFSTGKILNLEVASISKDRPTAPFKVVMIDDLCSRGGTFILGAKKLTELGATDIFLAITHCENSIFEGDIFKTDLIKKVYCVDTMCLKNENERLIVSRPEDI